MVETGNVVASTREAPAQVPARPIDDETLAVWADLLRYHATVTDILERELVAGVGMPLAWFDVG